MRLSIVSIVKMWLLFKYDYQLFICKMKESNYLTFILDARDAMAKAIYGRLFGWIVNKINCLIAPVEPDHLNFKEIGKYFANFFDIRVHIVIGKWNW